MEFQDAAEFIDRLGQFTGTVRAGDDFLGGGGFHLLTPVFDDTVGTLRRIAIAAVADDRVVGYFEGLAFQDLVGGVLGG